jgi:hypothetical protein
MGGPHEKLASSERISDFVDEVNRIKDEEGIPLKEIFPRFKRRLDLEPRTLRRKYEEEMRRRGSLT